MGIKNKVQLIGNIGKQPKVTTLENGKKLARVPLATNAHYTNSKGERQTNTNWHNLVAWGKIADFIENHVNKGEEIALEGKLTSRSYRNKRGNKHHITEVVVSEILLLGNKD
ncbi:single-strand DNA-binding protein [Zhouia amylolytica]|uniref:Single-stranded DNA-binding protein n=1 Tax=Zhouia amylolytica TaxID=376730 RepID=A0A1I6V2D6_9FLAO|nr:single-stranded DNA-binding protein [Zhouia amylolytica]SFT07776.1 single-strand DNA-binding protein [Zhouia amylolytica]